MSLPTAYGIETGTSSGGIVKNTWDKVSAIAASDSLPLLARGALHASLFETAFHNNTNNDPSKFSTGAYIYPQCRQGIRPPSFDRLHSIRRRIRIVGNKNS